MFVACRQTASCVRAKVAEALGSSRVSRGAVCHGAFWPSIFVARPQRTNLRGRFRFRYGFGSAMLFVSGPPPPPFGRAAAASALRAGTAEMASEIPHVRCGDDPYWPMFGLASVRASLVIQVVFPI